MSAYFLATLNACLNFTAFCLLLGGFKAIKTKRPDVHRIFMLSAIFCSMLFLTSYVTKHYLYGSKSYAGEGWMKGLYYSVLATHIPLAILMVPFIIGAVYFALKGNFKAHKRIVRWVYPCWMYVSVTGVTIYLMLYVF